MGETLVELALDSGRCVEPGEAMEVYADVFPSVLVDLFPVVFGQKVYPRLVVVGGLRRASSFMLHHLVVGGLVRGKATRIGAVVINCGDMPRWFRCRLQQRVPLDRRSDNWH